MKHGLASSFGLCTLLLFTSITGAAAQESGLRLGGVVYSEYRAVFSDSTDRSDFDVTRAYLNVIGRFDHGISTRVTADIYRNADGSLGYRLKYAYFAWTPSGSMATFKFGGIHTPWLDWEEALWGYRMQGTMAMDRAGYLTSGDLGGGVDLNWREDRLNAQFALVNGEGYSHASGGTNLDIEARGSVRLVETDDMSRVGGFRLTAYAHLGKRDDDGNRDRWIGMASYRSKLLLLAGEYGVTKDGATNPSNPDTDGRVISAYGALNVPRSNVSLLGRLDAVDPNADVADNGYTRILGGIACRLGSNIRLLADLEHTHYQASVPGSTPRTRALFQTEFSF
jgi:Phosphate-selective porin O and P